MRTEDDLAAADHRPSPYPRRLRRGRSASAAAPAPDLPNCRPIPLKREDLDTCDGRFEFWDGDTRTAWVLRDPTSFAHEHPSQRLAGLAQVIAGMRGSPIECGGTMDLERRDEHGERWRILRADQLVYLHPGRSRRPDAAGMVVGEHDFPDVVLEVDAERSRRAGVSEISCLGCVGRVCSVRWAGRHRSRSARADGRGVAVRDSLPVPSGFPECPAPDFGG